MNKSLQGRVKALASFIAALQIIKAEVVFRALPLPRLLDGLARDGEGAAAHFFGGIGARMGERGDSFWACAQPALKNLKATGLLGSDVRALSVALHVLGRYDSGTQAEALDCGIAALSRALEEARAELGQKGRVYRAMGVTVGIMLALMVV